MQIAYTGWTWLVHHQDNNTYEFEQFIKEIAYLGYTHAENFAFISDYFDGDAQAVKAILDKYGVAMSNLYLHFSGDGAADYAKAVKFADFMEKIGAKYMNLQGVMWQGEPIDRPTDERIIGEYAELSGRIGRMLRERGMSACFHPHCCTPVYTQEQIDLLLRLTDPADVSLCLDTAHTTIAGMDPAQAVRRYANRIGYMHLKDVDGDCEAYAGRPMARFLPLGLGTVDFRGVLRELRRAGYDGVLCVELDNPPVSNFAAAQVSRQYIKNALGL